MHFASLSTDAGTLPSLMRRFINGCRVLDRAFRIVCQVARKRCTAIIPAPPSKVPDGKYRERGE